MSLNKLILSQSFTFDDQITRLVPLHSRGVDKQWMIKHANHSIFAKTLANLKPIPGKSILQLLAVGDEEMYSSNRNGDAFNRKDNIKYHPTFVEFGKVFKHHEHGDERKAVGDVLASAHSDLMDRIELLIAADNDKCRQEIEDVDNLKDVGVSMGASVKYDVCTLCGNKAPTAADHCNCIRTMLNEVMSDGTKVYMQNPEPQYFDISFVWKPADRIAYVLRKCAMYTHKERVLGGHELAELFGLQNFNNPKLGTLRILATMQKTIPGIARAPVKTLSRETKNELVKSAKTHTPEQLLGFLNSNGWLLGADDFAEIIVGSSVKVAHIDELAYLNGSTLNVVSTDGVSSAYKPILSDSARYELNKICSMLPEHQLRRSICYFSEPEIVVKVAQTDVVEAMGLAYLYSHYKLSFAHSHFDNKSVLHSVAATYEGV